MEEGKMKCTISTPQFCGKEISRMFKQSGIFYKESLLFTPNSIFNGLFGYGGGKHKVQFNSIEDFEKARIK